MPKSVVVPPQAARTIEGLRDTGYEPSDALEDIIDNSIAAGASEVVIRVWTTPAGEPIVAVCDNGYGMDEAGLVNAMTYGSAARQSPASLGKFGLGLKTASTAMCRRLTVVTRSEENAVAHAATWDLDYVQESDEWWLQRPDPTQEQIELLDETAAGGPGTLVIWSKVDRLISDYKIPTGAAAKKALGRRIEEFRRSLALTYLRYLRGDPPQKQVRIVLNDEEVEPWDPFGMDYGTELLLDREVSVEIQDHDVTESTSFRLRAFALPPRSELTKDQRDLARIQTSNQGFYVFREGRLLAHGTWLGLRRVEPHLNLARIEFAFDHKLDDAFQIDIKKSRIQLQSDLQDHLRRLVQPAIAEAQERYRKNQRSEAVTTQGSLHDVSNQIIGQNLDQLVTTTGTTDGSGQATIQNSRGLTTISIGLPTNETAGPHIVVRESLDDGLLWMPTIADGKQAVALNAGHPYYRRVYLANRGNGVAIQGLNFLFWGLCEAEWAVITDDEKDHMEAVRREVSRVARFLANELPDIETSDDTPVSDAEM